MSRAAVVVNPTKLHDDDAFRESVRRAICELVAEVRGLAGENLSRDADPEAFQLV